MQWHCRLCTGPLDSGRRTLRQQLHSRSCASSGGTAAHLCAPYVCRVGTTCTPWLLARTLRCLRRKASNALRSCGQKTGPGCTRRSAFGRGWAGTAQPCTARSFHSVRRQVGAGLLCTCDTPGTWRYVWRQRPFPEPGPGGMQRKQHGRRGWAAAVATSRDQVHPHAPARCTSQQGTVSHGCRSRSPGLCGAGAFPWGTARSPSTPPRLQQRQSGPLGR